MTEQLVMFDYWEPEENLMTPYHLVRQYHKTAGLPLDQELDDSTLRLRETLLEEEFNELMRETMDVSSTNEINKVNVLKELADVLYVTYGWAATFGWDLDEAFRRVHENNMGRMYQPDGTIKRREDGKIMKNKDYPKVELGDLV